MIIVLNEVIMPTGQVAIPEPILKILGVSNGDRIGFIIEKDSVRMVNPAIHTLKKNDDVHSFVSKRIGIAKGKIHAPENLDLHNDEILKMFGVE